jgi:hypothetical protein
MSGEKDIVVIHITELFRKKISGYNEIGRITKEAYYELIHKIKSYYNRELEEIVKEGNRYEHK